MSSKELFDEWQSIGERIKSLGVIVQNEPISEYISPDFLLEHTMTYRQICLDLYKLHASTFRYVVEERLS